MRMILGIPSINFQLVRLQVLCKLNMFCEVSGGCRIHIELLFYAAIQDLWYSWLLRCQHLQQIFINKIVLCVALDYLFDNVCFFIFNLVSCFQMDDFSCDFFEIVKIKREEEALRQGKLWLWWRSKCNEFKADHACLKDVVKFQLQVDFTLFV